MPNKVPLVSIGVQREGVTMYPVVGKIFDFTDAEIADLDKMTEKAKRSAQSDPGVAIPEYYRDPVNEDTSAIDEDAEWEKRGGKNPNTRVATRTVTLADGDEVVLANGDEIALGNGKRVTVSAGNSVAGADGAKITLSNGSKVTLSDGRKGTFSYSDKAASSL